MQSNHPIYWGIFGGGTQNRTGVHGFADIAMIYNSIFYNE